MRVIFCIYAFRQELLAQQPWLTFFQIGKGLIARGHQVYILTDVSDPADINGFITYRVKSLRRLSKDEVFNVISVIHPDALVFLPTPLNLITSGWLDAIPNCRCVAFTSYSFYTLRELLLACRKVEFRVLAEYLRHLLIPVMFWRTSLNLRFDAIISQSHTTLERLSAKIDPRITLHLIPPGIDLLKWPVRANAPELPLNLLYIGAASKIRGFDILLDAMASMKKIPVRLCVLARGADNGDLNQIRAAIMRRDLGKRVDVTGGWMQHSDLLNAVHTASAVVLPFVLVPSDLPVSVMEAIACGTPVIGSRIDGLPSTISRAGTVAKQASPHSLAHTIMRMNDNPKLLDEWYAGCIEQRNEMMSWGSVTGIWEKVLFDEY